MCLTLALTATLSYSQNVKLIDSLFVERIKEHNNKSYSSEPYVDSAAALHVNYLTKYKIDNSVLFGHEEKYEKTKTLLHRIRLFATKFNKKFISSGEICLTFFTYVPLTEEMYANYMFEGYMSSKVHKEALEDKKFNVVSSQSRIYEHNGELIFMNTTVFVQQ